MYQLCYLLCFAGGAMLISHITFSERFSMKSVVIFLTASTGALALVFLTLALRQGQSWLGACAIALFWVVFWGWWKVRNILHRRWLDSPFYWLAYMKTFTCSQTRRKVTVQKRDRWTAEVGDEDGLFVDVECDECGGKHRFYQVLPSEHIPIKEKFDAFAPRK